MAQQNWSSEQDEILIDFVRSHEALYNVKSAQYKKGQFKQKLWQEIGTILHRTSIDCSKRWVYIRDYYVRKQRKPGTGSAGEAARKRSDLLSFLDSCPSGKRRFVKSSNVNSCTNKVIVSTVSNIEDTEESSQSLPEVTTRDDIENTSQTNAVDEDHVHLEVGEDSLSQNVHSSDRALQAINFPNNITPTTSRSSKKRKLTSTSEARLQLLQEIARRPQPVQQAPQDKNDLYFAAMAKIVKTLPTQKQIRIRLEVATMIGNAQMALCNQNKNTHLNKPGRSSSTDESSDYNYFLTL